MQPRPTLAQLHRLDVLHVFYEDLAADFAGEMERIRAFLGVPAIRLIPQTAKQNTQSLAERIGNFETFRAALAGTQYAWMLDAPDAT